MLPYARKTAKMKGGILFSILRSKLVLTLLFLILLKGVISTIVYGPVNIGWLTMNRGLSSGDKAKIFQAQKILSEVNLTSVLIRFDNLVEAKLSNSNLVINGGFEYYQQGWVIMGGPGTIPTISKEQSYFGENSLEIIFPGEDVNFYQAFQKVTVEENHCYQLVAYVKSEGLTDGVAIEIWDGKSGYQKWYGGRTQLLTGTNPWIPIEHQFCTPETVDSIQVRLRRYGGQGIPISGIVWFDQIKLVPLGIR